MSGDDVVAGIRQDIRKQLISLARNPKKRKIERSSEAPIRWDADRIINPENGMPFSPAGAWALIADELEAGCLVETIVLKHPPGKTGYVFKKRLQADKPLLYIKLQIGKNGLLFGRSFHYDEVVKS